METQDAHAEGPSRLQTRDLTFSITSGLLHCGLCLVAIYGLSSLTRRLACPCDDGPSRFAANGIAGMLLAIGLPLAPVGWIAGLWMLRKLVRIGRRVRLGDAFFIQIMIDAIGLIVAIAATIDDSPTVAWSVFLATTAVGPFVAVRASMSPPAALEPVAVSR